MNQNYNKILQNLLRFLNTVDVTGIDEANRLTECGLFIDAIARGEFEIIQTKGTQQQSPSTLKTEDRSK